MNINPGEFRCPIKIIKITKTQDENLVYQDTQEVYRSCFAKVSHIVGSEIIRSNADFREINTRFFVRHNGEITTDMFIEYKGKLHNIIYVNNYYESNEYDEIWCCMKELV
jgi:SPP1 family predicted phage head-tail adaptor